MTTQFIKPTETAKRAKFIKPTKPAKRVTLPPKDKSHFEEFTERTNWQGQRMLLRRCSSWKKHTGRTIQCGSIAKNGYNTCIFHGAHPNVGKRTPEGEARRLASCTKDGKSTKAELAKVNKRTQQHRTLTKLAYALGEQNYNARGQQRERYPAPTIADVPNLINTLLTIENTTAE